MKNERGQSLVEMIVSISIVTVSILGVLVLVNRSLALSRTTAEEYIATYLASEGLEVARNIFDQKFLATQINNPGSSDFYGWGGSEGSIIPSILFGSPEAYEIEYDSSTLIGRPAPCPFTGGTPTAANIRKYFESCASILTPLYLDQASGLYSYNIGGIPSKFKRVIIVDYPQEFDTLPPTPNLDYRVTSAVGWETGSGSFTVQLESHFMPWRIP
jgi:hypothetical protein